MRIFLIFILILVSFSGGCLAGKADWSHQPTDNPVALTGTGASVAAGELTGVKWESALPAGLIPLLAFIMWLSHKREMKRLERNGK